jgi:hypothetical protein
MAFCLTLLEGVQDGYLTTLGVMRLCSFDDRLISCVSRRTELLSQRSALRERRDVKCVLRPRLVVTPVRSRLSLDKPLEHSGY